MIQPKVWFLWESNSWDEIKAVIVKQIVVEEMIALNFSAPNKFGDQ
jgi:hypothetical protein